MSDIEATQDPCLQAFHLQFPQLNDYECLAYKAIWEAGWNAAMAHRLPNSVNEDRPLLPTQLMMTVGEEVLNSYPFIPRHLSGRIVDRLWTEMYLKGAVPNE